MAALDDDIAELSGSVPGLPMKYVELLRSFPTLGDSRLFRERDGSTSELIFWQPREVLERLRASPVSLTEGLLAVGRVSGEVYVLSLVGRGVFRWTPEMKWGATPDEMELIDPDLDAFLARLWLPPPELVVPELELARHGNPAEIDAWMLRYGVDAPTSAQSATLPELLAKAGRTDLVAEAIARGCRTTRLVGMAVRGGSLPTVQYLLEAARLPYTATVLDEALSTPDVITYVGGRRRPGGG
ncbi:MAG: hypothetical protein V4850_04425 [Myxococcota bacterium]